MRYAEELVHLTYSTSARQDVSGAWEFGSEDTLVGTSEHPFWSETRHAWVPMGQLARGERLLLATGEEATVKAARVEAAGRDGLGRALQTPVYNFQVKGRHSYFAAPNEGATLGEFAWVHNADRYARPSSFRKGVRDTVWDRAKEKSTGRVRDPKTGQFMSKDKPWDMGHKPRHEFRKFKASAKA